ncbi:hypothetical protein SAY87_017991 [Trapa incisa]|uniref:60S ribosomal protein L21 n=1 Tax=Trapa incisa TaxID=236973 RepID=A0AAN7L4Q8_9MYRT|nr:hypothetical protein SAY87_017991 [Trapa incisa]
MQVGNRIIRKRIHVRIEHVQTSRCQEEFKLRKVRNDERTQGSWREDQHKETARGA